jgi:hypothetical protein
MNITKCPAAQKHVQHARTKEPIQRLAPIHPLASFSYAQYDIMYSNNLLSYPST